jgi:AcrR family transcriptional regulator
VARAAHDHPRREQVLRAAVRVFSERGYRATSMNDLADAVGLSKPALYHYVRSKEDLLVQLYEQVMRESLRSVRATAEADREPVELLREVLIERVAYTCENRRLLQIFFEEESELPRRLMTTVSAARSEYEDVVTQLVERCMKTGALELPTSPRIFVNTVLGAANWVYKWYNPRRPLKPRELGEQIADVLLAGVTVDQLISAPR